MEIMDRVQIEVVSTFEVGKRDSKTDDFELSIKDPERLLTDKMKEDVLTFATRWYENDEVWLDLRWDGVSPVMEVEIGEAYHMRYYGTVEIEKLSEGRILLTPFS